jgi:hypothetical protein
MLHVNGPLFLVVRLCKPALELDVVLFALPPCSLIVGRHPVKRAADLSVGSLCEERANGGSVGG